MEIEKTLRSADQPRSSRKPRSDGQRNRDLIIKIAKDAFTENGASTSLDDIAKKSGVGAGTLYRHFPSRDALIEAVYRADVDNLADTAERFCNELPPLEALSAWLHLLIEHLVTKKIIAPALNNLVNSSQMFDENKSKIHQAVTSIYDRAIEAGDIRPDVNPMDHLRAIVGVMFFGTSEDCTECALRLADTLIQGSRPL